MGHMYIAIEHIVKPLILLMALSFSEIMSKLFLIIVQSF